MSEVKSIGLSRPPRRRGTDTLGSSIDDELGSDASNHSVSGPTGLHFLKDGEYELSAEFSLSKPWRRSASPPPLVVWFVSVSLSRCNGLRPRVCDSEWFLLIVSRRSAIAPLIVWFVSV